MARLRQLATARIEPAIGLEYAALLDSGLIDQALRQLRTEEREEIRATYRLLHNTYGWARRRRWTKLDPLHDVTPKDVL